MKTSHLNRWLNVLRFEGVEAWVFDYRVRAHDYVAKSSDIIDEGLQRGLGLLSCILGMSELNSVGLEVASPAFISPFDGVGDDNNVECTDSFWSRVSSKAYAVAIGLLLGQVKVVQNSQGARTPEV